VAAEDSQKLLESLKGAEIFCQEIGEVISKGHPLIRVR
jgi:hypothetical protein